MTEIERIEGLTHRVDDLEKRVAQRLEALDRLAAQTAQEVGAIRILLARVISRIAHHSGDGELVLREMSDDIAKVASVLSNAGESSTHLLVQEGFRDAADGIIAMARTGLSR